MKQSEVKIGFKFDHGIKGECTVTDRTKRTITIKHKFGKTKTTYRHFDAIFSPTDF
jgi:hypothetical protein